MNVHLAGHWVELESRRGEIPTYFIAVCEVTKMPAEQTLATSQTRDATKFAFHPSNLGQVFAACHIFLFQI